MDNLTKILLWRTAALLKIAAYVYKDKIAELEFVENNKSRKMTLDQNEFTDYIAGLVRARTTTHNRLIEHKLVDLESHDQAQEKLYDDMLLEIKKENSHLKLSKFITEVEERSRLKEMLAQKKNGRNQSDSSIETYASYKTIRRRNAQLSPQIQNAAKSTVDEYWAISTFKLAKTAAASSFDRNNIDSP